MTGYKYTVYKNIPLDSKSNRSITFSKIRTERMYALKLCFLKSGGSNDMNLKQYCYMNEMSHNKNTTLEWLVIQ